MRRVPITIFLMILTTAAAAPLPTGAPLTLGGILVLEFRASAGGFTPEQRRDTMQDRVVEILSRPELEPEDVRVQSERGGHWATVTAGPVLLVTATEADARANQSTPAKLAALWAANFRVAFGAAKPRPPQDEEARNSLATNESSAAGMTRVQSR